jgi:DNA polymerase-3 subunit delta'
MIWPEFDQALAWLNSEMAPSNRPPAAADLHTLLTGAGGRPADALAWAQGTSPTEAAQHWQALPQAMARGDASVLADWTPAQTVDALQKLCHDVWAVRVGAAPRFFEARHLPAAPASGKPGGASAAAAGSSLTALASWSKELNAIARTVEHPYHPGLLLESLVSRARTALTAR